MASFLRNLWCSSSLENPRYLTLLIPQATIFLALPRAGKAIEYASYFARARALAKDVMLSDNKDLQIQVINSKAETLRPRLIESERPALEQERLDALKMVEEQSPAERENFMRFGILADPNLPPPEPPNPEHPVRYEPTQ